MIEDRDRGHTSIFLLFAIFQFGCGTTPESNDPTKNANPTNEDPQVDPQQDQDPVPEPESESAFVCGPKPNDQMAKLGLDVFQKYLIEPF